MSFEDKKILFQLANICVIKAPMAIPGQESLPSRIKSANPKPAAGHTGIFSELSKDSWNPSQAAAQ